jgi:hypothetical protein
MDTLRLIANTRFPRQVLSSQADPPPFKASGMLFTSNLILSAGESC